MSELVAVLGLAFLFAVFGLLRLADRSGATTGCHGCAREPVGPPCTTCDVEPFPSQAEVEAEAQAEAEASRRKDLTEPAA